MSKNSSGEVQGPKGKEVSLKVKILFKKGVLEPLKKSKTLSKKNTSHYERFI